MITRCSLTRISQLADLLDHRLHDSKTNPKLLQALIQLDRVTYSGNALGCEEEA